MPRPKAERPSQTVATPQGAPATRQKAAAKGGAAPATDLQKGAVSGDAVSVHSVPMTAASGDAVTAPKSGARARKATASQTPPVGPADEATQGRSASVTSARSGGSGTGGTPLTDIRNIGPATAEGLIKAGIPDAETLRALGGHEAYRRWLGAGLSPHFIGYYVLVMALQGRPWNDCGPKEKADLRRAFDALKAEVKKAPLPPDRAKEKDRLQWEAILDEIGLITPPKRRHGAGD